jgi:hypothetical protein
LRKVADIAITVSMAALLTAAYGLAAPRAHAQAGLEKLAGSKPGEISSSASTSRRWPFSPGLEPASFSSPAWAWARGAGCPGRDGFGRARDYRDRRAGGCTGFEGRVA